jgi:hypothetical protein
MPRLARFHLFEAYVLSIWRENLADVAAVGPLVLASERDSLTRDQFAQVLRRLRAEGLVMLRCVDSFEPNGLNETLGGERYVDRVAIGHANHSADVFVR